MREILNRTVEGPITGTYSMYWYPTLPRSEWTKAFELSQEECTKEFTWTMKTREELEDIDKAQHKLANSQTYIDYCDAQRYGKQIYNVRTNGGRNPITP